MNSNFTPIKDIPNIVTDLRKSYNTNVNLSYHQRVAHLKQLYAFLENETDALYDALHKDLRKPQHEFLIEIGSVKETIVYAISNLKDWMETGFPSKPLQNMMDQCEIRNVPLGVVLIVSPWNFPIVLTLQPLVGAIAGGNTTVLKLSEISSRTSDVLARLLPKYLSSDLCRIVLGAIPETQCLLNQHFDLLFYTGNTSVGKIYIEASAKNITPVVLELGGKSPVIVDHTVDLITTARRIIGGKIMNCGQVCLSPDYVLIEESIMEDFLKVIKIELHRLLGSNIKQNPAYGRIISNSHFKRLQQLLNRQLEIKGTKLIIGGDMDENDLFISPVVLAGMKLADENPIMSQELFGPILPVFPIKSIQEGIDFINKHHPCPLAIYPFSKDMKEVESIISQVNSGGVCVNDVIFHVAVETLPFGGVGPSGLGKYHGKSSFETFTRQKSILIKSNGYENPNDFRYPHVIGDTNSNAFKILKWVLNKKVPSNAYLIGSRFLTKYGSNPALIGLLGILVGFKLSKFLN
ncbi:aldehyde dehydrogenase 3 family, member D1 [Globomyces pollinis-pini]|nr:aldehyde dehydrogenase 3 family, member D1 [Globomyces pollinis-pini]